LRAARANRLFCTDKKRIRTEKTVMVKSNKGSGLNGTYLSFFGDEPELFCASELARLWERACSIVGASLLAIASDIASKLAPTPNGSPLGGQDTETMIEFSTEKRLK
jgi:hypothetical protein